MADGAVSRAQHQNLEAELTLWKRIAYCLAEETNPEDPETAISYAYEEVRRGQ